MKTRGRLFIPVLVIALLLGMFAGCGSTTDSVSASNPVSVSEVVDQPTEAVSDASVAADSSEVEESAAQDSAVAEPIPDVVLPLVEEGSVSISIWYPLIPWAAMMGEASTPANWQLFRELVSRTGVTFEFDTIDGDNAGEMFSLLVAGGDLTDMFCGNWYSAGVDRAIEDGIYLPLNDLIDEYCPHYAQQLEREDVKYDAITDQGNIGAFYHLANKKNIANGGLAINGKLLEQYTSELPQTYDEYDELFAALKAGGVEVPIFRSPFEPEISGGYHNIDGWFVEDGVVQLGMVSTESEAFYTRMSDWYSKGYIMQDYYSSKMVNEISAGFAAAEAMTCGIFCGIADSIRSYPDAHIQAMYPMTQNRGEWVNVVDLTGGLDNEKCWVISGQCDEEKQILISQVADYLYSDEGVILNSWGVEGETFDYDENGDAQLHDDTMAEFPMAFLCFFKYTNMSDAGLYDIRRESYGLGEEELAACEIWGDHADDSQKCPNITLNEEEQDIYNMYYPDCDTYIREHANGFIVGLYSMDEWDSFVATLNDSLHFQEVVDVMQSAYDRYISKASVA